MKTTLGAAALSRMPWRALIVTASLAAFAAAVGASPAAAQSGGWTHWGADERSSRYAPLDQINAENFGDLEVAWVWRADNFGPQVDGLLRSTPIYAEGKLFGVAGYRRTVVALDPATGETLWTFREPPTQRWERSMRKNYGKGVSYGQVDGEGRIYVVTPGFFLHALDPDTGYPIENFGDNGTIDLLADFGYEYHPTDGLPSEVGYITNSSPPMVVNGVVVVGNSHEQGYRQTRQENVPGHILAYDASSGDHLWKFNVIPQSESEFGFDTWENDAWRWTGNVSAWAPLSADSELGLVYIVTDPPTNDHYGGFHPGDNLFATSILALDIRTGERRWHFQTVHHDIWNYDNPTAPNLVDIEVDGETIPAIVQTTKQSYAYVLNRETGEPIWPIEERSAPRGYVPGEYYSPTQPHPTKPPPYEMQGINEDDLIDFTPELRQRALDILNQYEHGPLFTPPLHRDNDRGKRGALLCPGGNGGTNILGGSAVDPTTGVLYTAHIRSCGSPFLVPGAEVDAQDPNPVGQTVADWVSGDGGGGLRIEGIPIYKPPYGSITAIDLNQGEILWSIPNGDTPERFRNHRLLQGIDIGNTGQPTHATVLVTDTLLMYGEGRGGEAKFRAVNKATGEQVAAVDIPAPTNSIPATYMHQGRQYLVMPISGGPDRLPGSLVALALPD